MEKFSFYNPTRIHFGKGKLAELGQIVSRYGNHCLLVTTSKEEEALKPLYERTISILEEAGIRVFHFDEAVPNPTIQCVEKAISIVQANGIDCVVACGGGSSIDTAKAVVLFHQQSEIDWNMVFQTYTSPFARYPLLSDHPLPFVAVPTTAGTGSEMTQAAILSNQSTEEKMSVFHDQAFPKEALIDPELTLSMPPRLTAITGFDAFSHAFESYLRSETNIYTRTIGLCAMKLIIEALPQLMHAPNNLSLRSKMSQAAMLAGISLSNAGATIPHPLSEVIGGISPRIPHGQALACLYPAFLRHQANKTPLQCAEIARLFSPALEGKSTQEAADALPELMEQFLDDIGLRKSLYSFGITEEEKEKMLSHFLLGVLPFGTKEELTNIMKGAFEC